MAAALDARSMMLKRNGFENPGPGILTIARGAGIGFLGMVVGSGLRYVFQIIVARNLGADLFGIFILGFAAFKIAVMIAELGLSNGVVRYVALFNGEMDERRVKGIVVSSIRLAGIAGIIIALTLFLSAHFLAVNILHKNELVGVLRLFAMGIPFAALATMLLFSTQGLKIMKYKVLVRELFEPGLRMLIVIILFMVGAKIYGVITSYLIPIAVAPVLAFYCVKKAFPPIADRKCAPIYETKKLLNFSWPLFFVQFFGLTILWIDTLMLGYFKTAQDVGVYGAAQRTALLGCVIITSFNAIFTPIISDLYNKKELKKLNIYFKIVAKWIFTFSFPLLILMIFFARSILNIFGPEFTGGVSSLVILSIGWIIYSTVGPVGQIIIMTGRQRLHLVNMIGMLVIDIILNIILIPEYGIVGAAVATALSMAFFSIVELWQAYLILGSHPYRKDFLKPVFSGCLSLLVLVILSKLITGLDDLNRFVLGASVYLFVYIVLNLIFGLQDEDKIILGKIKEKILTT